MYHLQHAGDVSLMLPGPVKLQTTIDNIEVVRGGRTSQHYLSKQLLQKHLWRRGEGIVLDW